MSTPIEQTVALTEFIADWTSKQFKPGLPVTPEHATGPCSLFFRCVERRFDWLTLHAVGHPPLLSVPLDEIWSGDQTWSHFEYRADAQVQGASVSDRMRNVSFYGALGPHESWLRGYHVHAWLHAVDGR